MTAPTPTYDTIQNIRVAQRIVGSGTPIVMLHGWGADSTLLWPLGEKLASGGFRVYMPDLPGFGGTGLPPTAWSVQDYVHFVLAYLDHHQLRQVYLFGHSFGGRLSLVLGADHTERILKIALSGSAGIRLPGQSQTSPRLTIYKTIRDTLTRIGLRTLSDQLRTWYNNRYASEDYKNAGPLRETFLKVVNEDLTPFAKRVQPSTLLFWGDKDDATTLAEGKLLEQLIPDAGLVVYPGAGHYAYLERADEVARVILHFFTNNG